MLGGARGIVTIVGVIAFVAFLLSGLGVTALSTTGGGGPPCGGYNCSGPLLIAFPPGVTAKGLNATIIVGGITAPAGLFTSFTATLFIGGTNVPMNSVPPQSPTTYAFPSFLFTAKSTGSFPMYATVIGTYNGGHVTTVSPTITLVLNTTGTSPPPPSCGNTCPTASPSFVVQSAGLMVNLTDTSTTTYAQMTTVSIAWGDGSTSPLGFHATTTHSYQSAGIYTIADTVTITSTNPSNGGTFTSSSTSTLTVTAAPGQQKNTSMTPVPTAGPQLNFNAVTDAGLGFSLGIVITGLTGRWKEGALLTLGLGVGGFFGGPFL